ncbi:MAG TPA: chemotaxis protein CheW [Polyangiaceae bacterium]|jgi:purine-binding chemotaxis protein CheW|nr:chemotaxis protein CheW [Polyangiaceae bacterium]
MSRTRQICSFVLGDLVFGVEVMKVQEVLRSQAMTRVPLASNMVRGLINLRGKIVTAVDVRARFGLQPLAADREPMNVVLSTGDGVVSLLVDEIGDVLTLDESDFERPPATLPPVFRDVVVGVYKLERSLLLMLDVERIVTPERSPSAVGTAA